MEKANQTGIKDSIAKYGLSLKDLKAQVIQTVEGNLTYTQDNMYLSGTGFYNIISNSLQRDYIFGKERVLSDFWYNSDMKAYAAGFEVEGQIAPTEALRFWVNGSYTRTWRNGQTARDTVLNSRDTVVMVDTTFMDAVTNIPIAKSNFGVSYTAPFGLNAYLVVKGIWKMVQPSTGDNYWDDYDPGYWLVDMNLSQPVGKNFNITLGITNLLNKEYSYFRGVDPGPMRTVSLGMTSNF
jgi:outer membrane receptor protein involved in Fe transport